MNKWLLVLLAEILKLISPQLRTALVELVNRLEAQAKETPNQWDDIFVGLLKFVLLIP